MNVMVNHHILQAAVDAVFLCVTCGSDGFVQVGITREPLERAQRAASSAIAAQWAWVGSAAKGKALERRLRKVWGSRHRAGQGYGFDYAREGRVFRDGLNGVFEEIMGEPPDWRKVSPEELLALVAAGRKEAGKRQMSLRTPNRKRC